MRKVALIAALVGATFACSTSRAGTINIPAIHVKTTIQAVANEHYLAKGPAWWPNTGRPGSTRTVAIAGHDVTPVPGFDGHGPFHYLNLLHRGDKIYITWYGRVHAYRVTDMYITPVSNKKIALDVGHERVILDECWPRYSATHRLVVVALPIH